MVGCSDHIYGSKFKLLADSSCVRTAIARGQQLLLGRRVFAVQVENLDSKCSPTYEKYFVQS